MSGADRVPSAADPDGQCFHEPLYPLSFEAFIYD